MKSCAAGTAASFALVAALLCGCAETAPAPDPPATASVSSMPIGIPMEVMKPDGRGPFPAVVILHDCSGLGPRSSGSPARWARILLREGYVVLIPDSFSTRGYPDGVCTDASPNRAEVGPARRMRDAFAALKHARVLAYVDGTRVGVMGGSHGGATTLTVMTSASPSLGDPEPFAAAVALYPSCRRGDGSRVYRPLAPVLILAGELDDWTPAEQCRVLVARSRLAGHPVSIKVYPGAHHAFDSDRPIRYNERRMNPNAPGGLGATTGGNAAAWADSVNQVREFFARHLSGRSPGSDAMGPVR